jgi:putative oxidoreductase
VEDPRCGVRALGEMAIAYWTAHARRTFFPALNNGDGAILFCFVFLYLVFAGRGSWSIDNRWPS